MIVMASAAAVGATRAYFTSSASVLGESFATGSLKIDITANDTYQNGSNRTTVPLHFDNLKPGDTMRQWITFKNTGTLDIGSLSVNKSVTSDASGLLGQIIVSVACTSSAAGSETAYFTSDWGVKPTVSSWFNNSDMLDVAFYRTPAGVLHVGDTYTCSMDFTMPTSVGNGFQNQSASMDMTFTAEQIH